VTLTQLDTPLLRRALLVAFVALHILFVLGPADVLAPVDPWHIGRMVWQGQIPYRDFPLEYPPGAILAFLLPGAVPHGLAPVVLALQAVAAEAAVMWFVLRRVEGSLWRWIPLSTLLFPFLSGGFDALPMAAIAISTALLAQGAASGWWVAAVGAVVKLSPGVAWIWGRPVRHQAVAALIVAGAVLLVPAVLARHTDDSYLGYSLHRGVQVESVAASTAWVSQELIGDGSRFAYRFKSYEIDAADPYALIWSLIGLAGLAAIALRAGRAGGMDPWLAAFTAVVLLLIANKVLSPQFVAWPAPLAAVLGGRWFRAWLVIAALTMAAYVGEGPGWILTCAALRNVGLVLVAAAGLRTLWTTRPAISPR
jgi:glycosyl transferase family 87